MAATPSFDRNRLIATLSDWAKQRLTPAKSGLAQSFFEAYFHRIPSDDLARSDPEALYSSALAHLDLAEQRQPGQLLLRAHNPAEGQARMRVLSLLSKRSSTTWLSWSIPRRWP